MSGRPAVRAWAAVAAAALGCSPPASGGAALGEAQEPVTVSAEIPPDPLAIGPALGEDGPVGAASNGSVCMVASFHYGFPANRGFVTRVLPSGAVLDPFGIDVGPAATGIASDGTDFLVVGFSDGVFVARVSASGVVLDAAPIELSTSTSASWASAAYDGANYLVVWNDNTFSEDVFAARVTPGGVVLDSPPIAVTTAGGKQLRPSQACSAAGCFVVWLEGYTAVRGARVAPDGTVLDPGGVTVATSPTFGSLLSADVTFDGASYVVVWNDDAGIFGARVATDGAVIDSTPFALSTTPGLLVGPAAASDGAGSLVTWSRLTGLGFADVDGVRLTQAGVRLDPVDLAIASHFEDQSYPVATSCGGTWWVAWHDHRNGSGDVYGSRVTGSGSVLEPDGVVIAGGTNSEQAPAVASNSAAALVGWSDSRGEAGALYGARIGVAGTPLDPSAIPIVAPSHAEIDPSLSFDGSRYWVAWTDERTLGPIGAPFSGVYAARVDTDGTPLDPAGIGVCTSSASMAASPSIACGAAGCLVVWVDQRNPASDEDIYGARLDPSGTLLDPTGFPICTANATQTAPAVDWDGTGWLVVWEDARDATTDVYGARVTAAGGVLDGAGILISTDGMAAADTTPALAFGGADHFVVWNRDGNIVGTRVATDGSVVDRPNVVISNAADAQTAPRVADTGDGHNWLVAWQDHRSGTNDDVYAAWVSKEGVVLDPAGVAVSTDALDERAPALASFGAGRVLAAYERYDASVGLTRVATRILESDALDGTPCSAAGDCASHLCTDGFCCDRPCDAACETCATVGKEGICTCTGLSTCASNPLCKADLGLPCDGGQDCSTTFCSDGVCCSSACDGGCDICTTGGVCTVVDAGTLGGNPDCLPGYVCGGAAECPTSCTDDGVCAPGYYCSGNGACTPYCATDADCPDHTRCDTNTGKCVSGATCDGAHTITIADGTEKDCSPYACSDEGTCLEACTGTADCAEGTQCDERGVCVTPTAPAAPDGCSCRAGRDPGHPWPEAAAILCAAVLVRRRRRRDAERGRRR